jgi:hypothetical protein
MNSTKVAIPKLTRNSVPPGFRPKMVETEYVVDEHPLPENSGVLQLKMPIPRYSEDDDDNAEKTAWYKKSDLYSKLDAPSPPYRPHLPTNPVLAYEPVTEDAAFLSPATVGRFVPTHFLIPRGQFSVKKIIDMIRTIITYNDDLDEILPKNYQWFGPKMYQRLFMTTLVYTGDDRYSYVSRFAKMMVKLHAVESPESIAVELVHLRGDTRVCMVVFKTIRDYVLSNGNTEYKFKMPDFRNGWSEEYYLAMHDATA